MNGAHNYHKNIKMYVLRCTTIRLKQECGHKTSRMSIVRLHCFCISPMKSRLRLKCPYETTLKSSLFHKVYIQEIQAYIVKIVRLLTIIKYYVLSSKSIDFMNTCYIISGYKIYPHMYICAFPRPVSTPFTLMTSLFGDYIRLCSGLYCGHPCIG